MSDLGARASAALAELGCAPIAIRLAPSLLMPGEMATVLSWPPDLAPPIEVIWKAWVVAGSKMTPCLACYQWERADRRFRARRLAPCTERGLGTLDCGDDRA